MGQAVKQSHQNQEEEAKRIRELRRNSQVIERLRKEYHEAMERGDVRKAISLKTRLHLEFGAKTVPEPG